APIAHASARTNKPLSEGMVSLLEPFIDTIIICTLTGLVILASGAWTEKFVNDFQRSDLLLIGGDYSEETPENAAALYGFLSGNDEAGQIQPYTGPVVVVDGVAVDTDAFTVLHARSIAEDIIWRDNGVPYSGTLMISEGQITQGSIALQGRSLL